MNNQAPSNKRWHNSITKPLNYCTKCKSVFWPSIINCLTCSEKTDTSGLYLLGTTGTIKYLTRDSRQTIIFWQSKSKLGLLTLTLPLVEEDRKIKNLRGQKTIVVLRKNTHTNPIEPLQYIPKLKLTD